MRTSLLTNIPGVWPVPSSGPAADPVLLILSGLVVAGILALVVVAGAYLLRWLRKPVPAPTTLQLSPAARHSWALSTESDSLSASDARAAEQAWRR